jgi:hypothetical protein
MKDASNRVPYDKQIKSPVLGNINYLTKNNTIHNTGGAGKLEFDGFLKAIEMIAAKIHPELEFDQAVHTVVETYILQLEQVINSAPSEQRLLGGQPLKTLVEILKDPEMVSFLGMVHKSLLIYYKAYADNRGLLSFEKFVRFSKDFGIFPDIIPKGKISTFFYTLASIHNNNQTMNMTSVDGDGSISPRASFILRKSANSTSKGQICIDTKSIDTGDDAIIDQHLFIESIALCAFEMQYSDPQPTNIEKICYLLERMNQSDGPSIVQKSQGLTRSPSGASWDILFHIRKKYPHFFGITTPSTAEKVTFDDLLRAKVKRI